MARMFGMRANSVQSYNNFAVNDMGCNLCCAKELSEQSHFLDNSLVKPCLHQAAAPQIAEKGAPQ